MKMKYIALGIFLMLFSLDKSFALTGDLLQGFDVVDNGNNTCTISGWMMSHKSDNTNYTFQACDGSNCTTLQRNSNENRTEMNKEVTEGEYYDYDNIGVDATVNMSCSNITLRILDGSSVVSSAKLIDKNSTDAGVKISGTNCDLRSESGQRTNGEFAHFKTGQTFSINNVKENVKTDKGDIVTMYCVNVSNNYETINGHRYYKPGNDTVKCVFDSCTSLTDDNVPKPEPPEEDDEPGQCSGTGSFIGCNMSGGMISSCGGTIVSSCSSGTYTTGKIYGPSDYGSEYKLIDDQAECKAATCTYSQTDTFNLRINFTQNNLFDRSYNAYRAGTYFNNPSLGYFVDTKIYDVNAGGCPTWRYEHKKISAQGRYSTLAECERNCDGECRSYTSGGSGISVGGSTSGSNPIATKYQCYIKIDEVVYLPSKECQANLQKKCETEIRSKVNGSNAAVRVNGTATFATDSNDYQSGNKYKLLITSGTLQNIAYVDKRNGKVTYYTSPLDSSLNDKYNIYNNVHFIPKNYPTGSYPVIFDATFGVTSYGSSYDIYLGASCGVNTINLYKPTPNTPSICEKEPCGYGFIYRPINLSIPFPNSYLTGCIGDGCRQIGDNWYTWISDIDNQKSLAAAYSKLEYSVYLNNELMSRIRSYNKKMDNDDNGYLDLSINVDGSSQFFKSNEVGICNVVNGNDNNATLCSKNPGYFGLGIDKVWGGS